MRQKNARFQKTATERRATQITQTKFFIQIVLLFFGFLNEYYAFQMTVNTFIGKSHRSIYIIQNSYRYLNRQKNHNRSEKTKNNSMAFCHNTVPPCFQTF